jgi:hypothetical protein
MESLESYLRRTFSHHDFTTKLEERLGSATMRTRLLNRPEKAFNEQLLILSELTGLSAWELMERYNVGIERVSEIEKANHKKLHDLQKVAA